MILLSYIDSWFLSLLVFGFNRVLFGGDATEELSSEIVAELEALGNSGCGPGTHWRTWSVSRVG